MVDSFPVLKFVPESARNHARTDETVPLLLAAQAWTHAEPPNVTGEEIAQVPDREPKKIPLAYRASTLTTELLSHTVVM